MNKFVILLIIISCMMLITSCSDNIESDAVNTESTIDMKLAEMHFEGYPSTDACIYFSNIVRERTNGHINIMVYSNSKLGTENEAITKVINGEIDLARVNATPLSSYSKNIIPMILPYLINSEEHLLAVMDSEIGENMLNNLGNGLVGLNWYYSGSRCFYSIKPITCLEDMQGMNIRVQNSALMEDMIRCLGANPIFMEWQDMYDSFENNTIDAGENDISSYMNFAHSLIAPNYVMDRHVFSPSVLIMNEEILNSLSAEEQTIIRECAKESQEYELELWRSYEADAKSNLIEDGAVFLELSDEEKQRFRDACAPLYEKYASDCMDIVEEIRKLENN